MPKAFGWDQLRRVLCRMRSEMRGRSVVDIGGWGGVQWADLQANTVVTMVNGSPPVRIFDINPRRVAALIVINPGASFGFVGPIPPTGSPPVHAWSQASPTPFAVLPVPWGPLVQGEWWVSVDGITGIGARSVEYVRQ